MCGRVGSAKRMQEILRNCYKLISIWIKKFLGGKKYCTKIKRAEALFFVYNYYLTKSHKCAIINLDPPLGGRRSRNSHYTTSFKKSQIKSHRQIAQSFFPKSLFFVQPAQLWLPSGPRHLMQPTYATPFAWQPGPGRICPPRRQKVGPSKIFLLIGRPARRVKFPIWPQHCYKLGLSKTCFAHSLLWKNWSNSRDRTSPVEQSLPLLKVCPFWILRGKLIYVLNFDIIILNPKGKNRERPGRIKVSCCPV